MAFASGCGWSRFFIIIICLDVIPLFYIGLVLFTFLLFCVSVQFVYAACVVYICLWHSFCFPCYWICLSFQYNVYTSFSQPQAYLFLDFYLYINYIKKLIINILIRVNNDLSDLCRSVDTGKNNLCFSFHCSKIMLMDVCTQVHILLLIHVLVNSLPCFM